MSDLRPGRAAVSDLDLVHPVLVVDGSSPHWWRVGTMASRPLTGDGVSAFIRYEDEVAVRFGYLVSFWATEDDDGVAAGVRVYSVAAAAPGTPPRHHPSNDRRFRTVEIEASAQPGVAGRPFFPRPTEPRLWARISPKDVLVPVALYPSVGSTHVSILGAGLLPQRKDLVLAAAGLRERLAISPTPVTTEVFTHDVRTREKVAARVAAGRARPEATLTIGTLAQFEAERSHSRHA